MKSNNTFQLKQTDFIPDEEFKQDKHISIAQKPKDFINKCATNEANCNADVQP